ncbi:hypothetical protein [Pseudoalteromonas phage vB_PtuP_Slicky01]|nr:hypothetical protein [Pseudoalteromonas phage vB_PtuP_Slicky01]
MKKLYTVVQFGSKKSLGDFSTKAEAKALRNQLNLDAGYVETKANCPIWAAYVAEGHKLMPYRVVKGVDHPNY